MKTVQLKRLILSNFKGAKKLDIPFEEKTSLFGANGTFKSTTYDAFLWLLFGKNSDDKKDFSIKNTVDLDLNRQDHEVEAFLLIDGEETNLKRVYREKWEKKRGEEFSRLTGNETVYYWNGVPMQQKEFLLKINSVLDENVFKLITNPLAFNDLKWQDRRTLLTSMFGEVSDEELAKGNAAYEALVAKLTQGKTMSDYLKQILAEVKKAKDDLKAIPTRIDEVSKSIPPAHDFELLRNQLSDKDLELKNIESQISDKNKAFDKVLSAYTEKKIKASSLKADISTIEILARKEAKEKVRPDDSTLMLMQNTLQDKSKELESAKNTLRTLETTVSGKRTDLNQIQEKMEAKRKEWEVENSKEVSFDDNSFCCPTCKREFEAADVESKKTQITNTFNSNKQAALANITAQGQALGQQKSSINVEIQTLESRIENGRSHIQKLEEVVKNAEKDIENEKAKHTQSETLPSEEEVFAELLSTNSEYQSKKEELSSLEEIIKEQPSVDVAELENQKNQIRAEIDSIKKTLLIESQIETSNKRIQELKDEESKLSQLVANTERTQFLIESFEKLKMESLEAKVNSKFKMVKFKMFEKQVNGGEAPACEILVNGVPFSDANTASKINAGLDIINVLCDYYQVSAPIFIDNRESVVEIIDTYSQIINLIVSESDKTLRVA